MNPTDAVIAATYRCNARCQMCGIWRGKGVDGLAPDAYRNLPPTLRSVNVSGGEPFMREDLADVVLAIRSACPRAEIIISTNGLLPKRVAEVMRRLGGGEWLGLAVSVDGIGDMHDQVRGTPGAFAKAQATVRELSELGIGGVRLAFTATPENVEHLPRVYDLACQFGAEFTCALAQGSEHYFQIDEGGLGAPPEALRRAAAPVVRAELASMSPKRWARAYFLEHLCRFAEGRGRPFPCAAGEDFFFADPAGDVYPCNVLCRMMGNLAEQDFAEMWQSERARAARAEVAKCQSGCWMVCTARTAMRRRWARVLAWALGRKLRPGGAP